MGTPPFYWEVENAVLKNIFILLEIHHPPNFNLVVCFYLTVPSECSGDINHVI